MIEAARASEDAVRRPDAPEPSPDSADEPIPYELCGYAVVEALAPGQTYLAIGPGGRGVVLKKLDPDCLLGELLHPSVRERLSRVRELATAGVANLYGVGLDRGEERDHESSVTSGNGNGAATGGQAYLIWEYVQGQTLAERAAEQCCSPRALAVLARELVLTVEALHMQGIVHGALKASNAIVGPGGGVRLTHVSPLLYSDPAADAAAVVDLLDEILLRREASIGAGDRPGHGAIRELLAGARERPVPLRVLAARLASLIESQQPPGSFGSPAVAERRTRRGALLGALAVAALGVAAAWGVWHAAGEPGLPFDVPPWLSPEAWKAPK